MWVTPAVLSNVTCGNYDTHVVNTFLPYASFRRSARTLDNARLNRQRTEVTWIMNALTNGGGYRHHPATKMWAGREVALVCYGMACCDEWIRRGKVDNLRPVMESYFPGMEYMSPKLCASLGELPWWFGWRQFHLSHRSNLLRKKAEHYGPIFLREWPYALTPKLPYVWPGSIKGQFKRQHSRDSEYYVPL